MASLKPYSTTAKLFNVAILNESTNSAFGGEEKFFRCIFEQHHFLFAIFSSHTELNFSYTKPLQLYE